MDVMEEVRVGLGCMGRYMNVMEEVRVGPWCTCRSMDIMDEVRVGLGCMGRYMDVMEGFRVGFGCTGRSDRPKTDFLVSAENEYSARKCCRIRPITNIRHKAVNIAKMLI
jgi:hypothetical protein